MKVSVAAYDRARSSTWARHLEQLGAGFFHSPQALPLAFPHGDPLCVIADSGGHTVGVALAVGRRCRIGRRIYHVRMAAGPIISNDQDRGAVLAGMASALRARGAADLSIGSFDATGVVAALPGARPTDERSEYTISLTPDAVSLMGGMSSTHRRHARRGDRSGWILRAVSPDEAADVLQLAQGAAATRSVEKGVGFMTGRLESRAVEGLTDVNEPAGAAVFAAQCGRNLLGAALVGWANGRAFYLRGGSTSLGYGEHAAVWLHWMVMLRLKAAGMQVYNLGGTPAAAAIAGHEQHGLHRFKTAFGAQVIRCRGVYWPLRRTHMQVHRAMDMVRGVYAGR